VKDGMRSFDKKIQDGPSLGMFSAMLPRDYYLEHHSEPFSPDANGKNLASDIRS
jgi:hypothetical protein